MPYITEIFKLPVEVFHHASFLVSFSPEVYDVNSFGGTGITTLVLIATSSEVVQQLGVMLPDNGGVMNQTTTPLCGPSADYPLLRNGFLMGFEGFTDSTQALKMLAEAGGDSGYELRLDDITSLGLDELKEAICFSDSVDPKSLQNDIFISEFEPYFKELRSSSRISSIRNFEFRISPYK